MKYIFTIITILILFITNLAGQATIEYSNVTGAPGEVVEIDVTLRYNGGIGSIQFLTGWDPSIIEFVELRNLANVSGGVTVNLDNFNTDAEIVENGDLPFSTFYINPVNVNGSIRLFSIAFRIVGNLGDVSSVTADPTAPIEISNSNYVELNVNVTQGSVTVASESETVTLNASNITLETGANGCVSITARDFNNITEFRFSMTWDPVVATFSNVVQFNPGLTGISFASNFSGNTSNGRLGVNYTAPNPITLPNNAKLFDVCFTAGNAAGETDFTFSNSPVEIGFVSQGGIDVDVNTNRGKITVIAPEECDLEIIGFEIGSVSGEKGDNVCIPVSVYNFSEVIAFFGTIGFDNSALRFTNVQTSNVLNDFFADNFNELPNQGVINYFWENTQADCDISLNDGEVLFNLCFEILAESGTYPIVIQPFGQNEVGAILCENLEIISDFDFCAGQISVGSSPTFEIVLDSLFNPCIGLENGRIYISVSGGTIPYNYVWTRAGSPNTISTQQDLIGVGSGTYRVRVTDGGGNTEEMEFTINATALAVDFTVEPADMGNNGSIIITVAGGTAPYQYRWTLNNSFFSSEMNLTGLNVGLYSLLVTDANNCTTQLVIEVTDSDIVLDIIRKEPTCNGLQDGSIEVSVVGGGDFSFMWSTGGNTNIITGLTAGTYRVTVTDNETSETGIFIIILDQPNAISITPVSVTPVTDTGSDGGISINPQGGTAPYIYEWSTGATVQNLQNLDEGSYFLTITDANGCIRSFGPIVVSFDGGLEVEVSVNDVNCFGELSGEILVMPLNGVAPYTYVWSNAPTLNQPINPNLPAGSYDLTVTDNSGNVFRTTILVNQPNALVVNIETNPSTNPQLLNGSALAEVSGGVPPYSYRWDDSTPGSTTSFISGLRPGTYRVLVTDSNGCQLLRTTEVLSVRLDCFTGRSVITPNGDGRNDNLVITCSSRFENTLIIYDRYGQKVYETRNYADTWEGQHLDGSPVPDGVYYFVLLVKDQGNENESIHKGSVTVVRTLN